MRIYLLLALLAFSSCSSPKKQIDVNVVETANSSLTRTGRAPTVAIEKTMNKGRDEIFSDLLAALRKRDIRLTTANQQAGRIETDWISVSDQTCNTTNPSGAKLSCRVRMSFAVSSLGLAAGKIQAKYVEFCSFHEEIRLECADSEGEKMLLGVIADVRE